MRSVAARVERNTRMMRSTLLVLLAACRIGFDPIETPDASGARTADPHDPVECIGVECIVDCRAWSTCQVDCGTSSYACVVQCPETGCLVTDCRGDDCTVQCGYLAKPPTRIGTVATCP